MESVYLLLGTNVGLKVQNLHNAIDEIEKRIGKIKKFSSVYESEAWGFYSENSFLNQVILVETSLNPYNLLEVGKSIERQLGRIDIDGLYRDRIIDIDILFCGSEIVNDTDLIVPHPQLHLRNFTLVPLMEIAPDLAHPVMNKRIAELYSECPDKSEVLKFQI